MKKLLLGILLITGLSFGQSLEKTIVHDLPPTEEVVYFEETDNVNRLSSATVTAGTDETLILVGENFGTEQGEIYFKNADFGGGAYSKAYQILSWTDTEVEVRVPSFAGSGGVRMVKSDGIQLQFENIIVTYALINGRHQDIEGRVSHVDEYVLNINLPEPARSIFIDAVEEVNCLTKMNFVIGEYTEQTNNALDDVNLVVYTNDLPIQTLAATYNRLRGCINSGEVNWYIEEIDILINQNFDWDFNNPSVAFNFYQVMVHELLHASGMGHVIDESDVMHFATGQGTTYPGLSINNLSGRADQHNHSTTYPICGQELFSDGECSTLSIPPIEENNLTIKNIEVTDMLGRDLKVYYKLEDIPNGIFAIKINYDNNTSEYKKILKHER